MKKTICTILILFNNITYGQFSKTVKGLEVIRNPKEKIEIIKNKPKKMSTYLSCEIYNLYFDREKLGQFKNIIVKQEERFVKSKRPLYGGIYWYIRGKYEERISPSKAMKYYLISKDFFKQEKDTLGLILTTYGLTEAKRYSFSSTAGDTSETRKEIEQAITWSKKINSPEMEASGYNQLATHIISTDGNTNKIIQKFHLANKAIKKIQTQTPTHIDIYLNLSTVYRKQGDNKKAKILLDSAHYLLTKKYPNKWKLSLYYQNSGILEAETKNYNLSEKHFLKAAEICDKEMIKEKFNAYQNLSIFYNKIKNDYKKSIIYMDRSLLLQDEIYKEKNVIQLNELNIKYELEKKNLINKNLLKQNEFSRKRQRYYFYLILTIAIGLIISTYLAIKLKTINKKLRKANLEIEESNRTRSYLFGIIAHDLLRPAQALSGVSTLIKAYIEKKQWDQVLEVCVDIVQSTNLLQSQSENLLRWAMSQKNLKLVSKEKFNIKEVLEEVTQIFKLYADWKKINIQIDDKTNDKDVYADKKGLHLICRNIVDNSLKASPEGSDIILELSNFNDCVQLRVQDQGLGIPKETLDKINYVIKNPYNYDKYLKDIGIGTVVIALFAKQNNLNIEIINCQNRGSEFKITFP